MILGIIAFLLDPLMTHKIFALVPVTHRMEPVCRHDNPNRLGSASDQELLTRIVTVRRRQPRPALDWERQDLSLMRAQAIPNVSTNLGIGDRFGSWRVRWGIGRKHYRVRPGLYEVGKPDQDSPVLVTANYKLTFDSLRSELQGIDAWLLVLDTDGVNVWCAAGKGSFGTDNLVRQIEVVGLSAIVSHRRLIVPQLGATGVAAHEVHRRSGFRVVYGPIRAGDLNAFLSAGMRASEGMRRVTFSLAERVEVVGVEVMMALKWFALIVLVLWLLPGADSMIGRLGAAIEKSAPVLAGLLTGTILVPVLLPWIPGRAFSLKGALAGAIVVGATILLLPDAHSLVGRFQVLLFGTVAASFSAMQFTGATTFTSPSGVEWEMRRALPVQIGAVLLAIGIGIVRWMMG